MAEKKQAQSVEKNDGADLRPRASDGSVGGEIRDARFPDEKPAEDTVAQVEELKDPQ